MFFKKKIAFLHITEEKIFLLVSQRVKKQLQVTLNQEFLSDNENFIDFLKKERLAKSHINIIIGGRQTFSNIVVIPEIPEEEIRKVITWEIKKNNPSFWEDEVVFDFKIIDTLVSGNMKRNRILVVGANKKHVDLYCTLVKKTGLKPKLIVVEGMILKELYLAFSKSKNQKVCCFYMIDNSCVLTFIFNEKVVYIYKTESTDNLIQRIITDYKMCLDYLEKQSFNTSDIEDLLLVGTKHSQIQKELERELNSKIKNIDIRKLSLPYNDIEEQYLLILGLLIREVG